MRLSLRHWSYIRASGSILWMIPYFCYFSPVCCMRLHTLSTTKPTLWKRSLWCYRDQWITKCTTNISIKINNKSQSACSPSSNLKCPTSRKYKNNLNILSKFSLIFAWNSNNSCSKLGLAAFCRLSACTLMVIWVL